MSVYDQDLWKLMERMARKERQYEFIEGVKAICKFGIDRAKTIRDTFPLYTLHDETHICNVLHLMHELLGNDAKRLTLDEAAMLVICACCHDVGMSYSDDEKRELLQDKNKIDRYLDQRPGEYSQAYRAGSDQPVLDGDMQRSYFRSIHHERVRDLLYTIEWPQALMNKVDRDVVVRVCKSHGDKVATLDSLESTRTLDQRMCAVLLRLADILDFDDSRAPKAIYDYCGFSRRTDTESKVSDMEWRKHRNSARFNFPPTDERKHVYELEYCASCDNPQVEQGVHGYLNWVDEELRDCSSVQDRFHKRWRKFALPREVDRRIRPIGYESGSYRLTLDQDKVLELFVGNNLYTDQSVFVRELIQNAIDAVRTRQQLDKDPRHIWEPRINIRTWTDDEGYNWFRIQDNGLGMTRDTILNHLLKVGSSYYSSDTFQREKIRHHASHDYMPISRFGIGILSCFMDDNGTAQVEVSTRHYDDSSLALRLCINGTSGFYRLCNSKEHYPDPGPMQDTDTDSYDRYGYLREPGTAIAVRTNLFASGIYGGFKEIVDKYVAFPPVPIHYEGVEGSFDYPTEQELVAGVCDMGPGGNSPATHVVDLPIPAGVVEQIQNVWPEFSWPQDFKVQLGRLSLGAYAKSPYVSGAAVVARTIGKFPTFTHRFGAHEIEMQARAHLDPTLIDEGNHSIRLRITMWPMGMDNDNVNRISSEYQKFMYSDESILPHTEHEDSCLSSILDTMRNPSTLDHTWRTTIRERFDLAEEELDQEFERAQSMIGECTGLEPKEIGLALVLSQTREWRFTVCDLATLDWFKTWFGNTHARTGHRMLVAHNGITCGSAESLFCDKRNNSRCVAAILLLKDKYRPELGLARDGIRNYTLETQLVLELMRRRIQADGYVLGEDHPTQSADYHLLATAAYEDVLAGNKALARGLTLAVNGGEIGIDALVGTQQDHEPTMNSAPILMWDAQSGVLAQRYQRFCMARAQQMFTIRTHFDSSAFSWMFASTQLYPKKEDDLPQGYRLFPPAFFVLPFTQKDTCLATRYAGYRHWINARHPLAVFLLQNAAMLHDHTPGILMEFTRSLAEDDGEDLVRTVNTLIGRLRSLRSNFLNVPANIELTDDDLC